jgi:pimeloyl-ACP methyl ester carboxylesterase
MPKVKVGDINMYYEIHGKGEPLVMIVGIGGSMTLLFRQIPIFSKEYKLIVFDNRGAGRSDAPDIPYTIETMADDIAGLLNTLGIKSAHIIGTSMGGAIAQNFALRYPERVRSLTLASTDCGGSHWIPADAENTKNSTQTGNDSTATVEERNKKRASFLFSQDFIDNNPGIIHEFFAKTMEHPPTPQSYIRQLQALEGHDTYERLPEIRVPTMIIHGESDPINPVENARILASRIPKAELHILKNMRHCVIYEASDEVNRLMLDFLRRHRTK